jgi:hypothetical protein
MPISPIPKESSYDGIRDSVILPPSGPIPPTDGSTWTHRASTSCPCRCSEAYLGWMSSLRCMSIREATPPPSTRKSVSCSEGKPSRPPPPRPESLSRPFYLFNTWEISIHKRKGVREGKVWRWMYFVDHASGFVHIEMQVNVSLVKQYRRRSNLNNCAPTMESSSKSITPTTGPSSHQRPSASTSPTPNSQSSMREREHIIIMELQSEQYNPV